MPTIDFRKWATDQGPAVSAPLRMGIPTDKWRTTLSSTIRHAIEDNTPAMEIIDRWRSLYKMGAQVQRGGHQM